MLRVTTYFRIMLTHDASRASNKAHARYREHPPQPTCPFSAELLRLYSQKLLPAPLNTRPLSVGSQLKVLFPVIAIGIVIILTRFQNSVNELFIHQVNHFTIILRIFSFFCSFLHSYSGQTCVPANRHRSINTILFEFFDPANRY